MPQPDKPAPITAAASASAAQPVFSTLQVAKARTTTTLLDKLPVATIIHLIVVTAACIKWVLGSFDDHDIEIVGVLLGSNSLLAVGRGVARR